MYIFKFKFSKSLWGFREPLSQTSPLLYPGLRPRLRLCRHFDFRLPHKPNLWEQLGYSQTHSYRDGSCSGEKRPENEWRDYNTQNFLNFGEGTSSKTTRQVIVIIIGYVLNVLQIHRSQIKNIQPSTILILEFAQRFKGTTPQIPPSALRPAINHRLQRLDHNRLSLIERDNNEIREKITKARKDTECCLNCAPDCLQGFKFQVYILTNFLGSGSLNSIPRSLPLSISVRALPSILRHFAPYRFRLCPQFSPPKF